MIAKWYILDMGTIEICLITLTLNYQYSMSLKCLLLLVMEHDGQTDMSFSLYINFM